MLFRFLHLVEKRNEIIKLTWNDVNITKNLIRLWINKREKGKKRFDWLSINYELSKRSPDENYHFKLFSIWS